ncbi:MAG: hypothetical protein CMB64_04495 [Euryarchaeota archaeon]|nr:hypothetical protein [Euryarchaeota archaeon]
MMSKQNRPLTKSVWSRIDVKSWAITEFTLRQYQTRKSTWAIALIGMLLVTLVLLFYVKGQTMIIKSIDQDGDSYDWDGDGYSYAQELQYGTNPENSSDFPNVPALPASNWIDEDDFSYSMNGEKCQREIFGIVTEGECQINVDDDGDCERINWVLQNQLLGQGGKDSNYDGVNCSVFITTNNGISVIPDNYVDEDPDDNKYYHETVHRAFVLGFGKIGFAFLMGIFLPLFLATGLIRDEMESETLHYLIGKPIARGEFYAYRLGGYFILTWIYLAILVFIINLITGFIAPSETIFRFQDIQMWASILFATCLMVMAYGTIFSTFGIFTKYGLLASIFLGVWEFMMAMLTLIGTGSFFITRMSIVFWGMQIIDSVSTYTWTDSEYLIEKGGYYDLNGHEALESFYGVPSIGTSPLTTLFISTSILIGVTCLVFFIGQSTFKRKELK